MATRAEIIQLLKLKDEVTANLKRINETVKKYEKGAGKAKTETRKWGEGLKKFGGQVLGVNPAMFALGGAIAGVAFGIIKATQDTIKFGSELVDLQSKTGLSIQELQELKFAAEQSGVGFKQVQDAVLRMGRRTAAELPETTKFLEKLGVSIEDILTASPGEGFALIATRIREIKSPAEQAAAAMGVFGDAGLQVLPLINQGVQDNIDRFRELDVAMTAGTAQAAKDLSDDLTVMKARWANVAQEIGGAVIPAVTESLGLFERYILTVKDFSETVRAGVDALAQQRFGMSLVTEETKKLSGATVDTMADFAALEQGVQDLDFGTVAASAAPAKEGFERLSEQAKSLAERLGESGLRNSAQLMTEALEFMNASGNTLTQGGMKQLFDITNKLRDEGLAPLAEDLIELGKTNMPELGARFQEFNRIAEGTATSIEKIKTKAGEMLLNLQMVAPTLAGAGVSAEDFNTTMSEVTPGVGDLVAQMNQSFALFGQQTRAQLEETLATAISAFAQMKASGVATPKAIAAAEQQLADLREELGEQNVENQVNMGELIKNAALSSLSAFGARFKAAAVAEATINTFLGVSRAFKDYIFPASAIVAASVLAIGLANVAKITGIGGFKHGTPGLDFQNFGRERSVAVHGREAIIPQGGGHRLAGEIATSLDSRGGVVSGGRGAGGGNITMTGDITIIAGPRENPEEFAQRFIRMLRDSARGRNEFDTRTRTVTA